MIDPIIKPQDVVFTTDVKEHAVFDPFAVEQPLVDLETDPYTAIFAFTDDFDPALLEALIYNAVGD